MERLLDAVSWRLEKIGIIFSVYYTILENTAYNAPVDLSEKSPCSIVRIDRGDMNNDGLLDNIEECRPHLTEGFDNGETVYVAMYDSHAIGFVSVQQGGIEFFGRSVGRNDDFTIKNLYVSPDYRQRGISLLLRSRAFAHVKDAGNGTLYSYILATNLGGLQSAAATGCHRISLNFALSIGYLRKRTLFNIVLKNLHRTTFTARHGSPSNSSGPARDAGGTAMPSPLRTGALTRTGLSASPAHNVRATCARHTRCGTDRAAAGSARRHR